ncbi:unnamed protein product [Anisakis simplex]|uniref:Kelch-like protein 28 (inferred by orthology to a human protein) n=1 Tax=Anisakis simplex TaxID=6269 RepID=A0A0M3K5Y9_ANISI|nr:unnamed protein product [Anisakis simplex]
MDSVKSSESLREALSETETSSWSTGILHIGRALLEAARHNVALDIPPHSDFVGDEKANDKQQNGTVLNINNECDQGAVLLEGNKMVQLHSITRILHYHISGFLRNNQFHGIPLQVKLDCFEFAQISPYFRAAFFGNFEEARTKQIMFGDPESDKFLNCLEFVRHLISDDKENIDPSLTSISIEKALEVNLIWILDSSIETVHFQLLDIASYLLIEPALQVLSDRIIGITPASKLVAVYHYAENRYHPLAKRLWDLIVREFDKLLAGDAYFDLTEEEIIRLLKDKHLNIGRTEETVMVERWIKENRWNGNSVDILQRFLDNAKNTGVGYYEFGSRIPNSVLVASDIQLFETPRAYHGVVNTGKDLFTIGGFNGTNYYRSTRKFNLDTQELVEKAPMYDQRCYVACARLNENQIVALGGFAFNKLTLRSDGHCIVNDDKIYAIGGEGNQHQSYLKLANSYRYSERSGVRAAVVEGALCVCGGFDGSVRLNSCEFIDLREGHWHSLRPMSNPRSNFGIETLNDQIVVAGGYAGAVGTISEVEQFDFRADAWLPLPSMSMRRSAVYLTRIDSHPIIEKLVRPSGNNTNNNMISNINMMNNNHDNNNNNNENNIDEID